MIQSRAQFGYRGVIVALFAMLFTYMAFNVADQVLLAEGLHGAFGWNADLVASWSPSAPPCWPSTATTGCTASSAGPAAVLLPLMAIVTIGVSRAPPAAHAPTTPTASTGRVHGPALRRRGLQHHLRAYVSDYSRYLPRDTPPRARSSARVLRRAPSAIWLIALGAWLAIRLGATDGLVGLQTAGNNVITHLAALAGVPVGARAGRHDGDERLRRHAHRADRRRLVPVDQADRRARVITIVVLTVIWYVIGKLITGSAVDTVFTALTLMLYLLVPWTATNLVDFFFVRRGHYAIPSLFKPDGIYGVWAWRGLTAYARASWPRSRSWCCSLVTLKSYYTGPAAKALGASTSPGWSARRDRGRLPAC